MTYQLNYSAPLKLGTLNSYNMMLSQKVKNQMAKQKAPNARRMIVSVETLHTTSNTYIEAARQLRLFCNGAAVGEFFA
ncbi:MAG: hypothetical protein U9R29_03985 [Thermodesulfobacteriota bacterium]|nr:hypothetical protein [Thermodesulfobacteriota bacterium]